MSPLFLATVASATEGGDPPILKTGDLCVEFRIDFLDRAGDTWISNADRNARGVRVIVHDASGVRSEYLDDTTGCLDDYPVWVDELDPVFTLEVESRAVVNGVHLESWRGPSPTDRTFERVYFPVHTGTGTTFSTGNQLDLPLTQVWRNLAVAGMVFRLHDWNVHEPVGRACCLEGKPGFQLDGTCPNPAAGGYQVLTTPIQLQTDTEIVGNESPCCGSTLDDNGAPADDPPGLHTGQYILYKFAIAHEIGHIVEEMRMGAKEWGQYPFDVPDGTCSGDAQIAPPPGGTPTYLPASSRGEFTKEPMANVFREAWGNIVSVATWNDLGDEDCEFQVQWQYHDVDLDGVLDTDTVATGTIRVTPGMILQPSQLQGAYDCEGVPDLEDVGNPPPPLASFVTAEDWLDDVEQGGACDRDPDPLVEANRSSVADGTRMLWDLLTDQGLTPAQLSDLYVDMCPRGWDEDTSNVSNALPFGRLVLSAGANGITTEVAAEVHHVAH